MRYVLQLLILVAAFDISTALASDRIRLAQAVPGQIAPQGRSSQPRCPDPVDLSADVHGLRGHLRYASHELPERLCRSRTYQGHLNRRWRFPRTLNCTTQQLVCKQACTRPLP